MLHSKIKAFNMFFILNCVFTFRVGDVDTKSNKNKRTMVALERPGRIFVKHSDTT